MKVRETYYKYDISVTTNFQKQKRSFVLPDCLDTYWILPIKILKTSINVTAP